MNNAVLIRKILEKLQDVLSESGSLLDEQIGIFKILGLIRGNNIQQEIIKEEQNMPTPYDLNKVFSYQGAMAKGREEGRTEGTMKGRMGCIESISIRMIRAIL